VLYITLLDQFHPGIYSSQVIDVCDYINKEHKVKIRLVAFLSIKELMKTDARKKIKQLAPDALVLPAFPKLKYFHYTSILLFFVCLFTGERVAICRNVFCTNMALSVKKTGLLKKVVFDGRSAMAAEIEEYDVFPVDYIRKNIRKFENIAVNNSDYRIAVSNQLIEYWRKYYDYKGNNHVVIPCTLDTKYFPDNSYHFEEEKIKSIKKELGINENDITLVYAGSNAPWQSFQLLDKVISPILDNQPEIKLLFLSKENKDNVQLRNKYNDRVIIKWVEHKDVLNYLNCADYGILLREQSVTNKVASPTKFAEYLYAGLPILISENLGDFSEFVLKNDCGIVICYKCQIKFPFIKINNEEKNRLHNLSKLFMKNNLNNDDAFAKLISPFLFLNKK
jgi:glycosyltransferase involved in cell wall biosynthesis